MSLGAYRLSRSGAIGFETRGTVWNVSTIMDVNRQRDHK